MERSLKKSGAEWLRILRRRIRLDLRDAAFALRHCRRPLRVIAGILTQRRPMDVQLRHGPLLLAPEGRSLIPLLKELCVDRAYARPGFEVRPGDLVVDIGAHVGVFAIDAAARGAGRIVACEPSRDNVECLRRNAFSAGITNLTIVEAAIADRDGTVRLAAGPTSVGNTVVELTHAASDGVEVRSVSMQSLFDEHRIERVDLLKIDCEGSEGAVLRAMPPGLLDRVRKTIIEFHDEWSEMDHEAIAALLGRSGFNVEIEWDGRSPFGMIFARRRAASEEPGDTGHGQIETVNDGTR